MRLWGSGILNGLRITLRNMRRGPITIQYPHQRAVIPERARWAVQMKLDADGNHKCTACLACERACPDYIIKIDVTTGEERKKHIDVWRYELGGCMMCGLCVEACPFDAIEMGHDYELATRTAEELTYPLLEDTPAAQPKRKERPAPAEKPAGASAEKPAGASAAEPAEKPAEGPAEKPAGSSVEPSPEKPEKEDTDA